MRRSLSSVLVFFPLHRVRFVLLRQALFLFESIDASPLQYRPKLGSLDGLFLQQQAGQLIQGRTIGREDFPHLSISLSLSFQPDHQLICEATSFPDTGASTCGAPLAARNWLS